MATRKPANPELTKAVASLKQAVQHVRKAVRAKISEVRGVAATELAKVKAATRGKTGLVQKRVGVALTKADARLHKVIAKAQKGLDDAVRQTEKRYPSAAKKRAAKKTAPTKR